MLTQTYLAIVAIFWLLILSITSYFLAHGTDKAKEQYRQVTLLFIVLAWISVLGVPLYEWLKARI